MKTPKIFLLSIFLLSQFYLTVHGDFKWAICSKDEDCHHVYGATSHCRVPSAQLTKNNIAISPFCACKDPIHYYQNSTTSRCEKRKAPRRECVLNSNCPEINICQNRHCTCQFGSIRPPTTDDNGACATFTCLSDLECKQLWAHSKCEMTGNTLGPTSTCKDP